MAQIAEAYIHLRPFEVSDRQGLELGRYLEAIAVRTARNIFDQQVVVDVELEAGSLRNWVTVSGVILLYGAIADYKGFKESVGEMAQDARTFAEAVYQPFVQKADASKDQVYRFERRLKTPGKIYRLAKHLEKLEESVDQISARDMKNELSIARRELEKIEADLAPEERRAFEKIIRPSHLPPISKWPTETQIDMPKAALAEDDRAQPSLFDAELGFTLPLLVPAAEAPKRRLLYQRRTIVDPQARIGSRQPRNRTTSPVKSDDRS